MADRSGTDKAELIISEYLKDNDEAEAIVTLLNEQGVLLITTTELSEIVHRAVVDGAVL